MFVIESIVVIVTERIAYQSEFGFADEQSTVPVKQVAQLRLGKQLTGILQYRVIVSETRHLHAMQTVDLADGNLVIGDELVGVIIMC